MFMDLHQHWFRLWLGAWWHQAITWINVGLSSVRFFTIHREGMTMEMLMKVITTLYLKIENWKSKLHPMGAVSNSAGIVDTVTCPNGGNELYRPLPEPWNQGTITKCWNFALHDSFVFKIYTLIAKLIYFWMLLKTFLSEKCVLVDIWTKPDMSLFFTCFSGHQECYIR